MAKTKTRRSQEPTRTVIRRTVIKEVPAAEKPSLASWILQHPWWAILFGVGILFLLFTPLCTVTHMEEQTETVMVPGPTKELPPAGPGEKNIKVYQGYMTDINGTVTTIDAVNGIVNKSKAIGPPFFGTKTWVITLTDTDGYQTIYRDIVVDDVTLTGTLRVDNTGATLYTPTSQLIPKEVTTRKPVKSRVNAMQYLLEFGCQPYPTSE